MRVDMLHCLRGNGCDGVGSIPMADFSGLLPLAEAAHLHDLERHGI